MKRDWCFLTVTFVICAVFVAIFVVYFLSAESATETRARWDREEAKLISMCNEIKGDVIYDRLMKFESCVVKYGEKL